VKPKKRLGKKAFLLLLPPSYYRKIRPSGPGVRHLPEPDLKYLTAKWLGAEEPLLEPKKIEAIVVYS
jgi:hypothetical protein